MKKGLTLLLLFASAVLANAQGLELKDWQIINSAEIEAAGDAVSKADFRTDFCN